MHTKSCNKCGVSKTLAEFHRDASSKDGRRSTCAECARAKARAYAFEWRSRNPERARENTRRWIAEHPERHSELKKQSYARHGKAWNEVNAAWRKANPDKVRATQRRWSQRHPEKVREKTMRRHARKLRQQIGEVDYSRILKRDGLWCYLCWDTVDSLAEVEFDHVLALSRGGAHSEQNIRVAHAFCNRSKSDTPVGEYVAA